MTLKINGDVQLNSLLLFASWEHAHGSENPALLLLGMRLTCAPGPCGRPQLPPWGGAAFPVAGWLGLFNAGISRKCIAHIILFNLTFITV